MDSARAIIEAEIERMIAFLDVLDGDTDLEDGHDAEDDKADLEFSLGAPERHPNPLLPSHLCSQETWAIGFNADANEHQDEDHEDELDDDQCDREHQGDEEPSGGGYSGGEDDPEFPYLRIRRDYAAEQAAIGEVSAKLRSIVARMAGVPASAVRA